MNAVTETPGPRLRRERERQGLTLQKAADELRLDNWVIEALETDEYGRLGPSVYAKGHLKKYAMLLGIPAEEIVEGYQSLGLAPAVEVLQPAGVRVLADAPGVNNLPWAQIGATSAIALLIVGVILWKPWHQRSASTPGPHSGPSSQPVDGAETSLSAVSAGPVPGAANPAGLSGAPIPSRPAPGPMDPATDILASPAAFATPVGASAGTAAAAEPVPGTGRARIRMSFSADSWVEIRDATGRRLYAGNGRANSVKTIAGLAPLRVHLKYAGGVQLEINERAVAIGPQFVDGDEARFQAGADGVLRRDSRDARPRG
jgi:cytoskeleton protein RodZ